MCDASAVKSNSCSIRLANSATIAVGLVDLPALDMVLQQRGQLRHDLQINPHDVLNIRPLHFDDALFAIEPDGPMHLRHRSRTDWLLFD